VAENLARLGASVTLLSAVGGDLTGQRLLEQTADSGVNLDYVQTCRGKTRGRILPCWKKMARLSVALDDVRVMARVITPDFLNRMQDLFAEADMVMMDGSLTPAALKTVVRLARNIRCPYVPILLRRGWLISYGRISPTFISWCPMRSKPSNCARWRPGPAGPDTSIKLARQLVRPAYSMP
jgi:sugar/nucleoside kinase (ribokinase family)